VKKSDGMSETSSNKTLLYPAALLLLVFVVFANTLSNGFVFDDDFMIENNPAIRNVKYLKLYFVLPFFSVGQPMTGPVEYDYYRPLVLVSYLMDYHLWGQMPKGYHGVACLHSAMQVEAGPTCLICCDGGVRGSSRNF
jgi:hypothetical protein